MCLFRPALAFLLIGIGGIGAEPVLRESVFHVSRVDLAYEPETREELAALLERLNASRKEGNLPVFTFRKGDRVEGRIYKISDVTNAEGRTSRATLYADLSRLLEVERNLRRMIDTRIETEERIAVIRSDLSRALHAKNNDLPFATDQSGAMLDDRQVERLQQELERLESNLEKMGDAGSVPIESVLIPIGLYGEGDDKARLVAAISPFQKIDRELFIRSLQSGYSFLVEWTESEPVEKVYGNAEFGQDPNKKYWPTEYPRGVREVRYRVQVIW